MREVYPQVIFLIEKRRTGISSYKEAKEAFKTLMSGRNVGFFG